MDSVLFGRTKELCDMHGITPERLSESLGISVSSIRKWKTSMPSVDKVKAVAEYFDVSIDYLVGLTDVPITAERLADDQVFIDMIREEPKSRQVGISFPKFSVDALRIAKRWHDLDSDGQYAVNSVMMAEERRISQPPQIKKKRVIPLFGNSFAAGIGEPDFGNALEEYEVDDEVKADFAVRVNGKSMEPYLHDGQIALGIKGTPKTGDIVAIMVDGSFYVKQMVTDNFGNLYLLSLNRDYNDITVMASANSTVRCFGIVQTGVSVPLVF